MRILNVESNISDYSNSLQFLSQCLEKYYNKKVIILNIKTISILNARYDEYFGFTHDEALGQIEEKNYEAELRSDGYKNIIKYGMAFYGKDCVVKLSEDN